MKSKICIIGGCGHIGLSLGLIFAEKNKITLFDIDKEKVELVNSGKMPFNEPETQELLVKIKDNLEATIDEKAIDDNGIIIVATYGSSTLEIIKTYGKYLSGKLIIICSTLGLGETEVINNWLKKQNICCCLAYCPERVSQGSILKELMTIPQIISGVDEQSIENAAFLFGSINPNCLCLQIKEAEFAKLYLNTFRYLTFALGNQMFMSAEEHGVELYELHDQLMKNNPRNFELPTALFTAGPCLPKDAALLSNSSSYKKLIDASIELNNHFPNFLLEQIKKTDAKKIGILGMTFKGNCADLRNSLAVKMRDLLIENGYTVYCHDPYHNFETLEYVLENSDDIIMGSAHNEYRGVVFKGECLWSKE